MLKFIHARKPGRNLIHLVPAEGLSLDERFDETFIRGEAMTLCGKRGRGWIVDRQGERCERCWQTRHESSTHPRV